MCRTTALLALVVMYVKMAQSWDIAVSVGDRLEFYTNGTKIVTVHFKSRNLTAITYDEVHNMMLFVDKQSDNDAICGYNLGSTNIRCFIKRTGSNIQDLAFDPATELLFFTDTKEGSINSISLKNQESEDNVYGNLLIKVDDPPVKHIAVDSCRKYIYWTNAHEHSLQNIMERSRFSGSEREVVYKWLPVYSFAIDPKTYEIYYIEGVESLRNSFYRKSDLREQNLNSDKSEFINVSDDNTVYFSAPKEITVSKDYVYWMNSSISHTTVWQRRKNASRFEKPSNTIRFYNERPLGLAANYRIKEQVEGLQDCEALSSMLTVTTTKDNNIMTETDNSPPRACCGGLILISLLFVYSEIIEPVI